MLSFESTAFYKMKSTLSNEEHEGGNGRLRAHKEKFPPTNDNYLSLGWPDLKLTSVISFV
jgi:hypothetical protein